MTEKPKRKTGRPPKFPGQGVRTSHSLRVRGTIDAQLRAAAEANNRTIAEELEHRVNASFEGVQLAMDEPTFRGVFDRAQAGGRTVEDEAMSLVRSALSGKSDAAEMSTAELADFIRGTLLPAVYEAMDVESTERIVEAVEKHGEGARIMALDIAHRTFGIITAIRIAGEQMAALVDPGARRQTEDRMNAYARRVMAEQEVFGESEPSP